MVGILRVARDGVALDRSAGHANRKPREREIVALKFFAGLSNGELASVLGVSESNAGTIVHRKVQKLREACDATP